MDERFDWGEAELDFLREYPRRNAAQLDRDGLLQRLPVDVVDRVSGGVLDGAVDMRYLQDQEYLAQAQDFTERFRETFGHGPGEGAGL